MDMLIIILFLSLLMLGNVIQFIMLRGSLKVETPTGEIKNLTGREVEIIRRKLSTIGIQTITIDDVFNLIKTIRDTHLGIYVDDDPYVPADPYEDIDSKK